MIPGSHRWLILNHHPRQNLQQSENCYDSEEEYG
jgi:hypothetical protein